MILVNDPGSWSHIYPPLEHADWNGWTPTDLIFPAFLFMVGVSMTLSFASRVSRGVSRGALAIHVVRRSALIFAIGLFLNGFPSFDMSTIRIMGVLQRIAVCYLVAGLLYLLLSRGKAGADANARARSKFAMIAGIAVILLAGYWALLKFVPVPGYGAGHLGKDDNLGAYIDRTLMGGHLWSESMTWDPEGLLSTLPAIATLLIGILGGRVAAFGSRWKAQGRGPGGRGIGLDGRRATAASVFPDQQEFVDQHVCSVHRRLLDARAGRVLLGRGFARLAAVGRAVAGVRDERDPGVRACGDRFGNQHRF